MVWEFFFSFQKYVDYCNGEIEEEQKGFRNEGVGWATLYLMRGEMREVNGGGGWKLISA